MKKLSKNIINQALRYNMKPFDMLDDYWVIVIKGEIFAPKQGRMFHATRQDALKHWYNTMHWVVCRAYKEEYAKSQGFIEYWKCKCDKSEREIWETFKSQMFEEYEFSIIQWKYAKRDVCGESRA